MSDGKSQLQHVLDVLVFAPAGLAESAAEEFDKFAQKGRHRLEGQVHTARLVGQFAIQTARGEARRRLEDAIGHLAGGAGHQQRPSRVSSGSETVAPSSPGGTDTAPSPDGGNTPVSNGSAAALAIPGYDSLSASQVVQRLDGLSTQELEDVKDHEQSHRHRRTILSRVDQLLSGAPTEQS